MPLSVLHSYTFPLALPAFPPTGIGFITVVNLGPGGHLLCSAVHLNIILLIKGLPPPPLPPLLQLPCSRLCPFLTWHHPFVHPSTHPLASCQAMLLPFEKRRRHLCLHPFHVALISAAILQSVVCVSAE